PQREDHRHAARRGVSEQHAGVLELDGYDRRQVVLLARRSVQRRQGRAGADQLRQSWLSALAIPPRHHSQHGPNGMTRDEAKALADRVLSFSKADETRVNITSTRNGNTRFADASI